MHTFTSMLKTFPLNPRMYCVTSQTRQTSMSQGYSSSLLAKNDTALIKAIGPLRQLAPERNLLLEEKFAFTDSLLGAMFLTFIILCDPQNASVMESKDSDICITTFIAALFTIVNKSWKQPKNPVTDERINKMC